MLMQEVNSVAITADAIDNRVAHEVTFVLSQKHAPSTTVDQLSMISLNSSNKFCVHSKPTWPAALWSCFHKDFTFNSISLPPPKYVKTTTSAPSGLVLLQTYICHIFRGPIFAKIYTVRKLDGDYHHDKSKKKKKQLLSRWLLLLFSLHFRESVFSLGDNCNYVADWVEFVFSRKWKWKKEIKFRPDAIKLPSSWCRQRKTWRSEEILRN